MVELYIHIQGRWLLNGTYPVDNLTAMARAIHTLSQNPDVDDFRVTYCERKCK